MSEQFMAQLMLFESVGSDPKWLLYIRHGRNATEWPTVMFPAADGIPTVAARTKNLAELGYVPDEPDEHGWQWIELQTPDAPVRLVGNMGVSLIVDPED